MAHVVLPREGRAGQRLNRANLCSMLTRWSEWADVWLTKPLWPAGDAAARDDVKDEFWHATHLDHELQGELERLHSLAAATVSSSRQQWALAREWATE